MAEIKITGTKQVSIAYNSTEPVCVLDIPQIISDYSAEYSDIVIKGVTAYLEGFRLQYITDDIEAEAKKCKIYNNSAFLNNGVSLPPNLIINAKSVCTFGGLRMLGKTDKIYVEPIGLIAGEACWSDVEYRIFFYTL